MATIGFPFMSVINSLVKVKKDVSMSINRASILLISLRSSREMLMTADRPFDDEVELVDNVTPVLDR